MIIHKIWLKDFRNFDECLIEKTDPQKPLLIYALNNQGKTNILTSVFICGHAKTAHSKMDLESCIQSGKDKAVVGLLYQLHLKQEEMQKMYTTVTKHGVIHQYNDKVIRKNADRLELCPSCYISADTLFSFISNPASRREALDDFCQFQDPEYKVLLSQYKKCIRQKNKALKQKESVRVWNEQLIQIAPDLVQKRVAALVEIEKELFSLARASFSGFVESLSIRYMAKRLFVYDGSVRHLYQNALKECLDIELEKEQILGNCRVGPHLDDLDLILNGLPFLERFSRGIQRCIVLLFELSKYRLMYSKRSKSLLLLLDDAFCELDDQNKKRLMPVFTKDFCVIYTTADKEDIALFDTFEVKRLSEGKCCNLSLEAVT